LSSPKWASEDKGQVVHPLAGNLTNLGLNAIWLYNTSIYTARCIPPSCWIFSSAKGISRDSKVRKEFYKSAESQLSLLKTIGVSEMEKELEKVKSRGKTL
jgi:hypothetical protein